ncbi:hypothetical protein BFG57_05700 [Bacillus solimangrovi]|uniref:GPI inositol-deacylase PGAP1-like alpha/beta domain-containing protein n=2 Tax=Bacillus solimangrovi TaxID=1305675 RepID=A0A1E5LBE5_9BACI|nr:hypothetical protein BFG57_05700 [Bacillus solimangrovi]
MFFATSLNPTHVNAAEVKTIEEITNTPGTWYVGLTPPNVDLDKPPIVFVQGLHGQAQDWFEETVYYGDNDMYQIAYDNGYRTAFVQLEDATGGDAADMWKNGEMLASMLEEINQHFNESVNIVAHSKGGIDTQSALIHYDAWQYVNNIVTLSSPHHGTPLADAANSWWANWIAELIGYGDEGSLVLQTGEMENFRNITDNHENATKNKYFTLAGTDWGPFGSALYSGGLYIWEDNDGLVPVTSTKLPYAEHIDTLDLNHDNIRIGSEIFSYFDSKLVGTNSTQQEVMFKSINHEEDIPERLIEGGELDEGQSVQQDVYVENDYDSVIFQVWTADDDTSVELTSPNGEIYDLTSSEYDKSEDTQIFKNATIQQYSIDSPEQGAWKVTMNSEKKDAYLSMTHFIGEETIELDKKSLFNTKVKKDSTVRFKVKDAEKWDMDSFDIDIKAQKSKDKKLKNKKSSDKKNKVKKEKDNELIVDMPEITEPGTYNITFNISGKTADGNPFKRTIIQSVYIKK